MHYQTRRGASACWLAWLDGWLAGSARLAWLAWLAGWLRGRLRSVNVARMHARVVSHACHPESWIVDVSVIRLSARFFPREPTKPRLVWRGRCSSPTNQLVLLEQSDNVNWCLEEGQRLERDVFASLFSTGSWNIEAFSVAILLRERRDVSWRQYFR